MKIKTAKLNGIALRYAVAVCEGYNVGVITAEEQWVRFIEDAPPEEMEKYAKEHAEIKAGFKDVLCKIHEDGYKSAHDARAWNYDIDWAVVGPIIEREGINLFKHNKLSGSQPDTWCAHKVVPRPNLEGSFNSCALALDGPTPLIAAMRCLVAATLGDEVDVPDELV